MGSDQVSSFFFVEAPSDQTDLASHTGSLLWRVFLLVCIKYDLSRRPSPQLLTFYPVQKRMGKARGLGLSYALR